MLNKQLVVLEGSPEQVGREWGRINKKDIKDHLLQFFGFANKDMGLNRKILLKRAERYVSIINDIAPHWLKEACAIAEESGVNPDDYICFLGGKYRGIFFNECFSYLVVGKASQDGSTLFHKNRDTTIVPQSAYVKGIILDGKPSCKVAKYISIGGTSDTGCMMMVNEKGLCGSADTGVIDKKPSYGGVMNHDILRYIAERASTCEEAVEIIEDFISKGWYAGGVYETRWLFADKKGTGVHIDNSSQKIKNKFIRDNFLINSPPDSRTKVAKRILKKNFGKIEDNLMNFISRENPICAQLNPSSFTAKVSFNYTDILSYAWVALGERAEETFYIPLYLGVTGTPLPLVNGKISKLYKNVKKIFSNKNYYTFKLANVEEELDFQRANLEKHARLLLQRGKRREAKRLLTQGCLDMVRQTERILTLLSKKGNFKG